MYQTIPRYETWANQYFANAFWAKDFPSKHRVGSVLPTRDKKNLGQDFGELQDVWEWDRIEVNSEMLLIKLDKLVYLLVNGQFPSLIVLPKPD